MNGVRPPSIYDVFDVMDDVDVIYKSPGVSDAKKEEYILLAEDHCRSSCRMDNSRIIEKYVKRGSILLVEGYVALVEVKGEDRKRILKMLDISEYAQKMITVLGWDRFNHMAVEQKPVYICKYDQDTGESSISLDMESVLPLGEKLQLLYEEEAAEKDFATDLKRLAHEAENKEFSESVKEIMELTKDITKNARKAYLEELAETFPIRTSAMNYSLKSIEALRRQGVIKGKIFLVAGRMHLREKDGNTDPRDSLKTFHETLQDIPAIVLSSKSIDEPRSMIDRFIDSTLYGHI